MDRLSERDLDNLQWVKDFMNSYEKKNKSVKTPLKMAFSYPAT